MPLAGDFLEKDRVGKEHFYPLRIFHCDDCHLVQVLDVVSPEVMFSDYRYLSSVTSTLRSHFIELADELARRLAEFQDPLVVEVGSNDGVLLRPLIERRVRCVGVEPSKNVAGIAMSAGLPVLNRFFNEDVAAQILGEYGPASAVTGSNVFAHIDDMDGVFRGIEKLLRPGGLLVLEVHYLPELFRLLQWDFFYHEHLCYWSLIALEPFLSRHGLRMFDVLTTAIHGGSIRVYARKSETSLPHSARLKRMLSEERSMGLDSSATYARFGTRVREHARRLRKTLQDVKSRGKTLAGYGAPGRGNTLLCFSRIGQDLLPYLVDASPSRYGRITPGTHIPILPTDRFRTDPPDYALLLAWTYLPEISSKEKWFLEEGGRFIVPLPRIREITKSPVGIHSSRV